MRRAVAGVMDVQAGPTLDGGPVLRLAAAGEGVFLDAARWNIARRPGGRAWFNCVSERVGEDDRVGQLYTRLVRERRCLLLFEGFYEWQGPAEGRGKGPKQPWAVAVAEGERARYEVSPGSGLFAFAGVRAFVDDGRGGQAEGVALFTTEANALLRWVHRPRPRMPVVLDRQGQAAWLDPENQDVDGLRRLLVPVPDGVLAAMPVGRGVNVPGKDGPDLLEPAGETVREPPADADGPETLGGREADEAGQVDRAVGGLFDGLGGGKYRSH